MPRQLNSLADCLAWSLISGLWSLWCASVPQCVPHWAGLACGGGPAGTSDDQRSALSPFRELSAPIAASFVAGRLQSFNSRDESCQRRCRMAAGRWVARCWSRSVSVAAPVMITSPATSSKCERQLAGRAAVADARGDDWLRRRRRDVGDTRAAYPALCRLSVCRYRGAPAGPAERRSVSLKS